MAFYDQPANNNPPKCECHECTQIRWKMSFAGQVQVAQSTTQCADEAYKQQCVGVIKGGY